MATVEELLRGKGTSVHRISPETSVYDAACVMNQHRVGSLLVEEDDRLVGIFTERDILQRVVAQRRDADDTLVRYVMTTEVACCHLHTSVDEARGVMKNRRIRHLPVVDGQGSILGLISIGDLNAHENTTQEKTISLLEQYIAGRV
ncbi:MAG: CBS domain-containing protein [Gemmataceae bacterium]